MHITVRPATIKDLSALTPLFDGYRQFYEQPSDLALARHFLFERFEHAESTIFIAEDESGSAVGFTQLYPSFSSTLAARIHILNDLFVAPEGRAHGVGRSLLAAAAEFARASGAVALALSTARTNKTAQALYEATGWVRDDIYLTYDLALD